LPPRTLGADPGAGAARAAPARLALARAPFGAVREAWDARVFYLFALPFAALVIVFGLWPIAQSIRVAFLDSYSALSPSPRFVGLANFQTIFADPLFQRSLADTLLFTAVSVVANLAFALTYALILESPLVRRGSTFFRLAIFLPVITPDIAAFIVWKAMYDQDFGAINAALASLGLARVPFLARADTAMWALGLAELWKHVGFYTIIFVTNLRLIDPELGRAAMLDGAGAWQRLRYITVPQLRPAITVNAVYALIQFLKTFTVVVVMTRGGPAFATNFVSYYAYRRFDEALYGEATAMATTLFAIVGCLSLGLYWAAERRDWR
jgi:ABC-type sugar transport system permease subunit